jgi:acylphosphatase
MADADSPAKQLHAFVTGRVQAVGFREFVRYHASLLKLTGYVRNGDDGRTVEVIAEGPERALEELLARLREGPRMSRVETVNVEYAPATGAYARFAVEF